MKINLRNILLGIAVAACANAGALTLPDIVNRNMMLQQNSDAALWGWAKPGFHGQGGDRMEREGIHRQGC